MKENRIIIIGSLVLLLGLVGGDGYFIIKEIKITLGIFLLIYGLKLKFKQK